MFQHVTLNQPSVQSHLLSPLALILIVWEVVTWGYYMVMKIIKVGGGVRQRGTVWEFGGLVPSFDNYLRGVVGGGDLILA